jgi:hypothetical protein
MRTLTSGFQNNQCVTGTWIDTGKVIDVHTFIDVDSDMSIEKN